MNERENKEVENVLEFATDLVPARIDSNIEELQAFVKKVSDSYLGGEVTEENKTAAKEDLAALRKLREEIRRKVSGLKSDVLQPWDQFNAQVKDAVAPIDDLIRELADGLATVETRRQEAKRAHVRQLMDDYLKDVPAAAREVVSGYWNDKWLNATTSDKAIREGLENIVSSTVSALDAIEGSKFEARLLARFKQTWSYLDVFKEKARLEAQEQDLERMQQVRVKEKIDREINRDRFTGVVRDLRDKVGDVHETVGPRIEPPTGQDICFCTCYLVGTMHEIKQGVKAFRAQGGKIVRNSDYRKAAEAEISASGYQRSENGTGEGR